MVTSAVHQQTCTRSLIGPGLPTGVVITGIVNGLIQVCDNFWISSVIQPAEKILYRIFWNPSETSENASLVWFTWSSLGRKIKSRNLLVTNRSHLNVSTGVVVLDCNEYLSLVSKILHFFDFVGGRTELVGQKETYAFFEVLKLSCFVAGHERTLVSVAQQNSWSYHSIVILNSH